MKTNSSALFLSILAAAGLSVPAGAQVQDAPAAGAKPKDAPAAGAQSEDTPANLQPERKPDIHFVPTPDDVIEEMLSLTSPKKGEIMYDLGCGDGRIVITAAKKYGAKGIGIDIDPVRIVEAKERAKKEGVEGQVEFKIADIFKSDFSDANVITLYLLTSINTKLRPKILAEVQPGTRIASHAFSMGEWEADEHKTVDGKQVYFWVVPANLSGTWKVSGQDAGIETITINQEFQTFTGKAKTKDGEKEIGNGKIKGDTFTFTVSADAAGGQELTVTGKAKGDKVEASAGDGAQKWTAQRQEGTKGKIGPDPAPDTAALGL